MSAAPGTTSNGAPADSGSRTKDEHLGLRFWIQIGSIEIAGFSECSAISIEEEMQEYAEGGLNTFTHKLPVRKKYANITLKRGIDPGQDLYKWYKQGINGTPAPRMDISIIVYGPVPGSEVRRWDLKEAYPVKWTGPDLKSEAASMAVESLEIAYHGLNPSSTAGQN
jgi:phage tail-like protein